MTHGKGSRWAAAALLAIMAAGAVAFWAAEKRPPAMPQRVVRTQPLFPALPKALPTTLVYHETFAENEGGWTFIGVSPFDSPYGLREDGKLTLNAQGSDYSFGYWESPTIHVEGDTLYRAVFLISAQTDLDRDVPQFRLRVSSVEPLDVAFQGVAMLDITSNGTANYSPTTTPHYYEVWFRTPRDTTSIRLEFDLLSFEGVDDDPSISAQLDEAWVEGVGEK